MRRGMGLLPKFGRQRGARRLIEQGEALEDLGLIPLPQGGD